LNKDKYFFLHIPKTAGTSFRKLLQTKFKDEETFPSKSDFEKRIQRRKYNSVKFLHNLPDSTSNNVKLLFGHYFFGAGDIFYKKIPFHRLIFLRDPVERAISAIFHLKYISRFTKFRNWSHEEIFHAEIERFSQVYVKILSGREVSYSNENVNEDDFKHSLSNLQKFDFVGLTEEFNKSIQLAEEMFNWKLDRVEPQNQNIRARKDKGDLDQKFIEKIKEVNQFDLKLYHTAKEMFQTKCNKYKILQPF